MPKSFRVWIGKMLMCRWCQEN
ncbi:hypothetical protein ACFPZ2_24640 [Olivibacter domesticus]